MQYPESLRREVISRVLNREGTHELLAQEYGVGRSTIQKWMRDYRHSGAGQMTAKQGSPTAWGREERLQALLETHAMDEQTRGAWCRQRGVHSHQLEQWRQELIEGPEPELSAQDSRALRDENRALKKELRRKDKALAETSALLVLKKNPPPGAPAPVARETVAPIH